MDRIKLLYTMLLALGSLGLQAQNVGIGEPSPVAKLHVNQPANVDAVFVVNTGTGNAIEALSNVTTNTASMAWFRNGTNGVTLDAYMSNPAATASNILSFNDGLGVGVNIRQRNTGASGAGIFIEQNGNGAFSRGIDMLMQNTTTAYGQTIFHDGVGGGTYLDMRNTANNIIGSYIIHRGLGVGAQIDLTNTANTSTANFVRTAGIGRGLEVDITNAANTEVGSALFHAGDGIGQYVTMTSNTATRNSVGLFVQYNGSGGGVGGGGNAAEIQNYGTNGNAVDIFTGNPGAAPGPANTTNEYATLSLSHMATGTSPTPNAVKAAINAINHSEDPTIVAQNLTTTTGAVMEAYIEPNTPAAALATSIYGRADRAVPNGYGVALWGDGGNYGVIGGTSTSAASSDFGLLSLTNSGAFGIKSFVIDHPAAPTQKTLRHFSVESNEVLNLYRGIVELDANGQGVVNLPDYFDAINTNVTYQLTPIGTGVQPYVAVEEANNQFTVAGAPNTKVSWTIHAQRNDPTIQYFERTRGEDYKSPVTLKQPQDQGKYLVPEAYGQPKEAGVFYNAAREQRAKEALNKAPRKEALQTPEHKNTPVKKLQPSKVTKEGGELSNN